VRKISSDRPHTIEILLINYPLILAPADCSQEEKWFNALSYAMTGVSYIKFKLHNICIL